MPKHTWTLTELLDLSDRMLSRGTAGTLGDLVEVKVDCQSAGRILSHLLLTEVIKGTIVLGVRPGSLSIVPREPE